MGNTRMGATARANIFPNISETPPPTLQIRFPHIIPNTRENTSLRTTRLLSCLHLRGKRMHICEHNFHPQTSATSLQYPRKASDRPNPQTHGQAHIKTKLHALLCKHAPQEPAHADGEHFKRRLIECASHHAWGHEGTSFTGPSFSHAPRRSHSRFNPLLRENDGFLQIALAAAELESSGRLTFDASPTKHLAARPLH